MHKINELYNSYTQENLGDKILIISAPVLTAVWLGVVGYTGYKSLDLKFTSSTSESSISAPILKMDR